MPLLLTAFLIPGARAELHAEGFPRASGAEQVVPGMAVMFAFLSVQLVCMLFYREHAWATWDRLRTSAASTAELVVGKVVPLYVCLLAQMAVLFIAGVAIFGYQLGGSWLALSAIVAVFVATLVLFGTMLVAVFKSLDQAMVLGNLGGMVMAGLGGAIAPVSSLPGWARLLAHMTPPYWCLQAMRDVTLKQAGLADVLGDLAVLAGFAAAFAAVVAARFRLTDSKVGTT